MTHEILSAMKDNKSEVTIGDDSFVISQKAGWVITCNPGYAGRTVLPKKLMDETNHLKFTLPNRQDIVSIMMGTEGVEQAEKIAPMLCGLFMDCE